MVPIYLLEAFRDSGVCWIFSAPMNCLASFSALCVDLAGVCVCVCVPDFCHTQDLTPSFYQA